MISCSSSLASSTPATSLKVTFFCWRGVQPRPALAEAERLVAAALHLAHHEDPEGEQQHKRDGVDEEVEPSRAAESRTVTFDLLVAELVDDRRVADGDDCRERRTAVEFAVHLDGVGDRDRLHLALHDPLLKLRKGQLLFDAPAAVPDDWPEQDRRQMMTTQKTAVLTVEFTMLFPLLRRRGPV